MSECSWQPLCVRVPEIRRLGYFRHSPWSWRHYSHTLAWLRGSVTMPYCVAALCKNSHKDGKGFFSFPSDHEDRKQWVIKLNRAGLKHGQLWEPSKHSRLCSDHFAEDCFVVAPTLAKSIGFSIGQLRLKPGAVPTIFPTVVPKSPPTPRGAFAKRRRAEVCTGRIMCSQTWIIKQINLFLLLERDSYMYMYMLILFVGGGGGGGGGGGTVSLSLSLSLYTHSLKSEYIS